MKKHLILGLILFSAPVMGLAQYAVLKNADREFAAFNFSNAVKYYQEAFEKRPTVRALKGLAASTYQMRDFRQAEHWYSKLANQDKPDPEDILVYAHTLRNNARFLEAKAQYQRLALREDRTVSLDELEIYSRSCDSAVVWMQNPNIGHELSNEQRLNSPASEFGAIHHQGEIVFTSDRGLSEQAQATVYGWTGNSYLQLYSTGVNSGSSESVQRYPLSWYDATHHVGPVTRSSERNEVYFSVTRKLSARERRKASRMATVNIEIFSNDLTADDWGENPRPFRYNRITEWSVGDPFLSSTGDTLFFASDMLGGFGGTDIYYCVRQTDGTWGDAINMGAAVNTSGDERFPTLSEQGDFYFSSDGHIGMGGLDIFVWEGWQLSAGGGNAHTPSAPRNLGYPINSPADDFSMRFTQENRGFLASNRLGGMGSDDIYRFNLDREVRIELRGRVLNAQSKLPVSGAAIQLALDGSEGDETILQTHADGSFKFNLQPGNQYAIHAQQTGFKPFEAVMIDTRGMDSSQTIYRDLELMPVEKEEVVVLRNIYFDFDKSDIRPDAAYELSKVLSFLNSDPGIRIELSAHTDARGNESYNMQLSQRRADAVIAYLSAAGIDPDRLVAKGYGFSRLANHCAPGVECTEEEHQYNRRVEFFIIR